MDAIQVSEASMVSMFRRAADAIVNESSLKDEVDQLRMTTDIQGRNIERLGNDKSALNDYVAELQRQLSEAKSEIAHQQRDAATADDKISKLSEENETLQTLLNETEQARDSHKTRADENYTHFTKQQDMYIEAKAKLDGILKTLGAILPQGQSEPHPMESAPSPNGDAGTTTASSTDANTSHSEAAPEVAAEPTFPSGNDTPIRAEERLPSTPQPWSSGDSPTYVENETAPQEPVESSHTVAPSAGEPHPNKPSDWMNF